MGEIQVPLQFTHGADEAITHRGQPHEGQARRNDAEAMRIVIHLMTRDTFVVAPGVGDEVRMPNPEPSDPWVSNMQLVSLRPSGAAL